MNPGSDPNSDFTSSSCAGRKSWPSAFRSLTSFSRWSPRVRTRTGPRSSAITGKALIRAPAGTPSSPDTASIVVAPGVSTGSGEPPERPSTGCGVALATSTFAA